MKTANQTLVTECLTNFVPVVLRLAFKVSQKPDAPELKQQVSAALQRLMTMCRAALACEQYPEARDAAKLMQYLINASTLPGTL
jgi:hypothetical protein